MEFVSLKKDKTGVVFCRGRPRRMVCSHHTSGVDVDLDDVAKVAFVRFLHCKFSSAFSDCLLGKEVTRCSPHLRNKFCSAVSKDRRNPPSFLSPAFTSLRTQGYCLIRWVISQCYFIVLPSNSVTRALPCHLSDQSWTRGMCGV